MSARHKLHQRHLRHGAADVLAAAAQDGARPCAVQYATLPWRRGADGAIKVLLVTSRETRRWVIPKGWPMRTLTPAEAAAREAYE
ncbi:MAG: hypothetical protein ACXU8Q_10990 [Caulobacteraceae bacterium]